MLKIFEAFFLEACDFFLVIMWELGNMMVGKNCLCIMLLWPCN